MRRVVPVLVVVTVLAGCAGRKGVVRPGVAPPIRREARRPPATVATPDVHIRGPFSGPGSRPRRADAALFPPEPPIEPAPVARRERPESEPEVRLGFRDPDRPNFQSEGP